MHATHNNQSNASQPCKTRVMGHISQFISNLSKLLDNTLSSILLIVLCSFIVNILLETTLRQNIFSAFFLIFQSPVVFLLGMLIIFSSFTLIYLFKRRTFVFSLITILWITVIIVNFCLMCLFQRSTPFNFSDLRIFKTTLDIINNGYIGIFEFILILIAVIIGILLLVLAFIKCKKSKGFANTMSFFAVQCCAFSLIAVVLYTNIVVNADRFDNLPNKYREHGFVFCFLYSIVDNGIDKPSNYSPEIYNDARKHANTAIRQDKNNSELLSDENISLLNDLKNMVIDGYSSMTEYPYIGFDENRANAAKLRINSKYDKHLKDALSNIKDTSKDSSLVQSNLISKFSGEFDMPNIIFLQLESFYDVNNIEGYEYSAPPHPIYSMLKSNLPGGKLTVPSIGAGTANTEFEIMTGMDVSFFGIAEYPYLSVLQSQTCESIAYNAKDYGYTAHAIHNHKGSFYDRNKVFPNLGYDTFTSLENLPLIERNSRNWCKDSTLMKPIFDALDSSSGKDLIYTISVQPHGKYPSESVYNNMLDGQTPKIEVSGNDYNPENPGFSYYVNQLNEVDTFLGDLILELYFKNEPTVLVFYGDHLPSFSVQKYWNLKEGNCYQTDYIIWNNCGIDFSDAKDLNTFQLASYVFNKVGIDSGDVNKLNRLYLENESVDDYAYLRHTYQYAIFYDNSLKDPSSLITVPEYKPSDIQYGVVQASIDTVYSIGETTYITGDYFNEYTCITVNGNQVSTEFMDSGTIYTKHNLLQGDIISTVQTEGGNLLGHSKNTLTFTQDMVIPENLHDETLDMIIPSIADSDNIQIIEDATLDFADGSDEMEMVQDDINF